MESTNLFEFYSQLFPDLKLLPAQRAIIEELKDGDPIVIEAGRMLGRCHLPLVVDEHNKAVEATQQP